MGPQNTALNTGVVELGKATCEGNVSEALKRPDDGGPFISLWDLFAQIGKAETAFLEEAAGYLVSCLDNDPTGINYLRRRDESGRILPLDIGARLYLLRQLSIFASQGTLFDADDRPTDDAQPTFERAVFYTSDIYPFLARHDVAVSHPDENSLEERLFPDGRSVPGWILAYDGQTWISRNRATKILLAGTSDAELARPQYDKTFFQWDAALADAIERGTIATTTVSRKQMLAHADIRAWCAQHGYFWPLEESETRTDKADAASSVSRQQVQNANAAPGSLLDTSNRGLKKREQQIRGIEEMADQLGYPRQKIPDGGKAEIRSLCKSKYPELFGWGDSPFDEAWKVARKANRITMANHEKFAGK